MFVARQQRAADLWEQPPPPPPPPHPKLPSAPQPSVTKKRPERGGQQFLTAAGDGGSGWRRCQRHVDGVALPTQLPTHQPMVGLGKHYGHIENLLCQLARWQQYNRAGSVTSSQPVPGVELGGLSVLRLHGGWRCRGRRPL